MTCLYVTVPYDFISDLYASKIKEKSKMSNCYRLGGKNKDVLKCKC